MLKYQNWGNFVNFENKKRLIFCWGKEREFMLSYFRNICTDRLWTISVIPPTDVMRWRTSLTVIFGSKIGTIQLFECTFFIRHRTCSQAIYEQLPAGGNFEIIPHFFKCFIFPVLFKKKFHISQFCHLPCLKISHRDNNFDR